MSSSPSSPSLEGGKNTTPKDAISAIRLFFVRKFSFLLLLNFLLETDTIFNWKSYAGHLVSLPEDQLTTEIVIIWFLTHLFRKPASGESKISDEVWHRMLHFLRENSQHIDMKLLFKFIKKYQNSMVHKNVIPNWVQIVLAPLCESDASLLSSSLSNSFDPVQQFWQNALRGLTSALLPFWFTEQTSYVWQHLLYELIQYPLSEDIKHLLQNFFADKSFEFFMPIPVDLLILLSNNGLITGSNLRKYLFSADRRKLDSLPMIFMDNRTMTNPIVQDFLKKSFQSIWVYIFECSPQNFQNEFSKVFAFPHDFFMNLLEINSPHRKNGLLSKSGIQCQDMANFLNLFCWNTSIFFPTCMNLDHFVYEIMNLPDCWKFLFVQLWRCEQRLFSEFHIGRLVDHVRRREQLLFSKKLASMMSVYMKEVVTNAIPEVRKVFFEWLLKQNQSIQGHFPLTRMDVQFCIQEFPGIPTKKTLFWWLFTVHAAKIDKVSDRVMHINMTEVCQAMDLEVTEEELGFRAQNGLEPITALCSFFNVITLKMEFGVNFKINCDFTRDYHCDPFSTEGANPFRMFVYNLRTAMYTHIPNQMFVRNYYYPQISSFIKTCETLAPWGIFTGMPQEDRRFLIQLFKIHLPKLKLTEELVQLLHRLSELMPEDIKQTMFTICAPIKILHEEKIGTKRSRDPTDPASYEAQCSRCKLYFPLKGLGLDGHGRGAICRKCSQTNGTPILTTLSRLPFGSL